jgi:hypothetical protein
MALKGTMVIGQSGGPPAAINASLAGAVLEAKGYPKIELRPSGVLESLALEHDVSA